MAPYTSITVALFSFLYLVHGAVGDTCYYPDGSSDNDHFACSSGGTSMCCSKGFECLSNGLCNDSRYSNYQRVLRGGCTDKSWGDGCLQTCTSMWPGGEESVYLCSNGKYCCGRSNDCCDGDGSFFSFGQPSIIATAGKTKAQSVDVTPDEKKDSQSSAKADQPATKTSAQSTNAQSQDEPQETQDSQGDSPAASAQAQSPSAAQAGSPAATTTTPSTPNNSNAAQNSAASASDASSPDATHSSGSNSLSNTNSAANPGATNTIDNNNNNNGNKDTATPSSSPNSTVAIAAGVGVGIGVLLFLCALALIWYIRRKRLARGSRSKPVYEIGGSDSPVAEAGDSAMGEKDGASFGRGRDRGGAAAVDVYEMDGGEGGAELEAGRGVGELHGESAREKKWPGLFGK